MNFKFLSTKNQDPDPNRDSPNSLDPDQKFNDPQHSLITSLFFANIENLSCFGDTRLFFVELAGAGGTRPVEQDQAGVRGCGLSSAAIRLMLHGSIQQLHTEVTIKYR